MRIDIKKNIKRTALLVCATLTIGMLAGCGAKKDTVKPEPQEPTVTAAPSTETPTPTAAANEPELAFDSLSKKIMTDEFKQKLEVLSALIDFYYYEDVDVSKLQEGILTGLYDAIGDKYSYYLTAEDYIESMEGLTGEYCGIGAYVSQNRETDVITITKPFPNGPAAKAGMLAGDIVVKVDGEDITGQRLEDVITKIKGPENTKVVITVFRDTDGTGYKDIEITRAKVKVETVEHKKLDGNIGYVAVSEFDAVTVDQFKAAIDAEMKDGAKGIIVDLRNNGGGLLDSVVKMVDYILPQGYLITYTMDKNNQGDVFKSTDNHQVDLPIVVLVNEYSASASEVFTGALKDNDVAKIVGTTTFGKGIVQNTIPLTDGSAVQLTIARYFTPSGVCIHGIGIEPDVKVEAGNDPNNDVQLTVAINSLLNMIR